MMDLQVLALHDALARREEDIELLHETIAELRAHVVRQDAALATANTTIGELRERLRRGAA